MRERLQPCFVNSQGSNRSVSLSGYRLAPIVGSRGAGLLVRPVALAVGECPFFEVAAGIVGGVMDVREDRLAFDENGIGPLDGEVVFLRTLCRGAPELQLDFEVFAGSESLP